MKKTVVMMLDRETKGAVRFQEVGEDRKPKRTDDEGALLGTLYVRKKAFRQIAEVAKITVTIETEHPE